MRKLGKKTVTFNVNERLTPFRRLRNGSILKDSGHALEYTFDTQAERTGVTSLLRKMSELGVQFRDLDTKSSSLEDIFVSLVHQPKETAPKAEALKS
jgi:ABC-2 type transport system ATP-binding protein